MALGLRPGNEVITVPNMFIATTEAITQAGGRPVFVDVNPRTLNMDAEQLSRAKTEKTKGICLSISMDILRLEFRPWPKLEKMWFSWLM